MKPAFLKRRYFNQLERDINGWVKSGWLDQQGADKILASTRPAKGSYSFSTIIGIFGAILLAFSALSFVAANWQEMSKISRVLLLLSLMWAAFGAGWLLERKNYHGLKEAAYLLGGGLFGVNIALIAQIYHIDRHPPDGFMLWAAGLLLIVGALESRAALVASFLVITLWTFMETMEYSSSSSVHWGFLIFWGFATFLASKMKWLPAFHLSILSFLTWMVMSSFILTKDYKLGALITLTLIVLLMVLVVLSWLFYTKKSGRLLVGEDLAGQVGHISIHYAIFIMALLPLFSQIMMGHQLFDPHYGYNRPNLPFSLWGLVLVVLPMVAAIGWNLKQHYERGSLQKINLVFFTLITLWCAGLVFALAFDIQSIISLLSNAALFRIFMLAFAIWLVSFGQELHSSWIMTLGLFMFGVEVLYIYIELFGSLMDTSLFFLFGGVVLISLAYGLERMRRKLSVSEFRKEGDLS